MSNMDAMSVSTRIAADKTFAALFDTIRDHGDAPAAFWLKGEEEFSMTYAEMCRRSDDFAAFLGSQSPDSGWIAIAVDTCRDWPTLFWGVLRSGHNVLLLDASAPDAQLQGLLDEAGCKVLATIPSKDVLISKLLGSIKSPLSNLARVLSQIAEKQGEQA